jgi:cysteine desulfurase/selenocysteine lyase
VQALGAACGYLDALGRDQIAAHHTAPSQLAMEKLSAIPGIRIIGPRTSAERSGPA